MNRDFLVTGGGRGIGKEICRNVEIGKLDGHQKRIGAKVVSFPFYDPTKSRVRA